MGWDRIAPGWTCEGWTRRREEADCSTMAAALCRGLGAGLVLACCIGANHKSQRLSRGCSCSPSLGLDRECTPAVAAKNRRGAGP